MQIRRNYYVQKDRLRPGVFHFCQCRPALPASLAAPLRLAGGSKSPLHVLERPLGAPATQGPRWQRWAGRRGPHRSWNVRPTHLACKADPLSPLCPWQVLGLPRGGGGRGGLQAAHCGSPTPWWLPPAPQLPAGFRQLGAPAGGFRAGSVGLQPCSHLPGGRPLGSSLPGLQ